jgi:hypothetical protein
MCAFQIGLCGQDLLHLLSRGQTAHLAHIRLLAKYGYNPQLSCAPVQQLQLFEPESLALYCCTLNVLGLTFLPFPLFVGLASAVCWRGFQEK